MVEKTQAFPETSQNNSELQAWRDRLSNRIDEHLKFNTLLQAEEIHFPQEYKNPIIDLIITMEQVKTLEQALHMADQIDSFPNPYVQYEEEPREKFRTMHQDYFRKYGKSPNRARWALKGIKKDIGRDLVKNRLAELMQNDGENDSSVDEKALDFAADTFSHLFLERKPIATINPRTDFL